MSGNDSLEKNVYERAREANKVFKKLIDEGEFNGLSDAAMNAIWGLANAHTQNMSDAYAHGYTPE